jgi:hypothetical protein
MTAGGHKLDYPGDASSPAASMLDAKLHINSTISDAKHGARYLGLDIKNYFLGTPLKYGQYMRVHPLSIPQEIFVAADGYVYLEIQHAMYGLKEAAIIAVNQLVTELAPAGYEPMPFTSSLWRHCTKRTTFTHCVDDFSAKYFLHADALHLITALKTHYELTTNWTGALYCDLTLAWNYAQGYVYVSMPG